MESDPGPCRPQDPAKYFRRFYFNRTSSVCEIFLYGGCGGNHNNFENKTDCQAFCGAASAPEDKQAATFDSQNCVKSPKHGKCHLSEPRWFFSHWDNICKPYNYSGCGANMNSFLRSVVFKWLDLFSCFQTFPQWGGVSVILPRSSLWWRQQMWETEEARKLYGESGEAKNIIMIIGFP